MPPSRNRSSAPSFERAVRLHLSGELDRAAREYRRCVSADPQFAEAMNNLATILAARGQHADALALLQRAVGVQANYAEARHNIGLTLSALGRHAEAAEAFERAVAIEPERPRWWDDLANARVECFRFVDALAAFDRALSLEPLNADVWSNRGLALRGLRQADDAIASFRRALSIEEGHANALSNLGTVLKEERRFDEAIAVFEEALSRRPRDASLLVNFASVSEMMGDYERLRELAERARDADPSHAEPYVLLGNYWMEQGRYDEAERMHQEAVRRDPGNRNANWNLAILWLLRGDFARGWKQYEWRKRLQSTLIEHVDYPGPEWDGAPLAGRTLLLHAEQGIGDAIQFVRFAPLCKAAGAAKVIVEAPYPILPLLAGAPGVDATVARGAPLPAFDVHVPMLSLPYLLGVTAASLPASVPYLAAGERPAAAMVDAPAGVLRVGIVWAGNPIHRRDHLRSIALDELAPLFDVPGTRFYSLQKGAPAGQLAQYARHIVDLAPQLEDFRDTAAVMKRLDLVITVDTSVAHLAGALGLPVWTLITSVPDFRWMLERPDSPWYPTMRLFRQPVPRDWASVAREVRGALEERVALGTASRADDGPPAALTTLRCATARPDTLPRFELAVPLADLADPATFAAYEAELVHGGHERAMRDFLDEALGADDLLIDIAPGLGLTALATAAAPSAPRVVAIEADGARAARLRSGAASNQLGRRLTVTADESEARASIGGTRRCAIRVGDARASARAARLLHDAGSLDRPVALLWPAVPPVAVAPVLDGLAARGWQLFTVSTGADGVSLDPPTALDAIQPVAVLSPAMLAALSGATPATEAASTPNGSPSSSGVERRLTTARVLGFDWEVRPDSGWGVYGLNLVTHLARRGDVSPVVFTAHAASLPEATRQLLAEPLARQEAIAHALAAPGATMDLTGLMLRALGNNMMHGPLWSRVRARRNAGVIFFEDTAFDIEALARVRRLDAIIAGSSWNGEVLRSLGLANVHVVLQGIDPMLFAPAPRAGTFGDRFVIFSGGKLEYRKGQDIVVAAFRRFHERHPDALLVTAWHNHWASLITDLDLAGHTRGAPRCENGIMHAAEWLLANGVAEGATIDIGCTPNAAMPAILREADVALFPNRCEGGTNLVAMEAMACGVPTIVSANSGHLDLIATGGCFALTRQRPVRAPTRFFRSVDSWGESDVDEIVALLDRLYDDRAFARTTADAGARAMASLSWSQQIDSLLETLRPLL